MSTEQGNVQPWRENVERAREALDTAWPDKLFRLRENALVCLDALTTQIEELERDFAIKDRAMTDYFAGVLAENEQPWEDMRAYNIRLEERARVAERALAEIAYGDQAVSDSDRVDQVEEIARAALPSEDTSDEN